MRNRQKLNRREFITATSALAAAAGVGIVSGARIARAAESSFKTKLHKALIMREPAEDDLKKLKDAGFEGVEGGILSPLEAEKCRAMAEKLGMRIHSVLRGWADFNSPDESKVKESLDTTEAALRAAQAFGADAILLVPCRVSGLKMPRPWEFLIDFDPK